MKINFNIMWVDDKPDKMKPILDEIADILKENYFIPNIEAAFQSYESFRKIFSIATDDDGEINAFNDCDLILIDFHLSKRAEDYEKTGEALIDQLRKNGVFTEVVFYSDDMDGYRINPNRRELDNVTYADKSEVVRKVEHLVKKSVKQGLNISNLRGYLMDSTSEFDFVCREAAVCFFNELNDEQKKSVIEIIKTCVQKQYENEAKKFKKVNLKYSDILSTIREKADINNITESSAEQIKILQTAFNSKEAVIPTENKYMILAKILSNAGIECCENIYSNEGEDTPKEFYKNALITPRNKLAHSKLIYGEHCGKQRIKIAQNLFDLKCNNDPQCNTNFPTCAKQSFSYEECKELRKNIYNFYLIFNDLLERVINVQ